MRFVKCIQLYNHLHNQDIERFHHPQISFVPLGGQWPPQPLATSDLLSVTIVLPFLDLTHQWNNRACRLGLASFTELAFEIRLFYCVVCSFLSLSIPFIHVVFNLKRYHKYLCMVQSHLLCYSVYMQCPEKPNLQRQIIGQWLLRVVGWNRE